MSRNATGQKLTVWQNNTAGRTPVCARDFSATETYMPGFAFCPGAASDSSFPNFDSSYSAGSVSVNSYLQGQSGTRLDVTAEGCAPLTVTSPGSPIGSGGAFAFSVVSGIAVAPPAEWGVPPSACVF